MADEEIAKLWKQLADKTQTSSKGDPEKIASLRRIMGDLSVMHVKTKAEVL